MPGSPLSAPRDIRFRWYLQVEKYGKTIPETCTIFGISTKTYHKWYNRDHGYGTNTHRARRLHPQTKLTADLKGAISTAKLQYNYGPKKMQLYLRAQHGVTVSTTILYRYFKKKQLIRKPQRKQTWYTPMTTPFHAAVPGENVQLDVKYVPGGEGLWNYQYRFCDVFTGIQCAFDFFAKTSLVTIQAFKKAERALPFPVHGIQTDNGGEFRGLFAVYLHHRGIPHRFIPKRSAPWNGKVERANRSVDDEYYLNPTRPWKTLGQYTHWYNHERPHLGYGMNGMTPYEKLQQYLQTLPKPSPLKVN